MVSPSVQGPVARRSQSFIFYFGIVGFVALVIPYVLWLCHIVQVAEDPYAGEAFYTVHHEPLIQGQARLDLARGLTESHHEITKAALDTIKVMFHQLDSNSIFAGGEPLSGYIRVVADLTPTLLYHPHHDLLRGMNETVYSTLSGRCNFTEVQTLVISKTGHHQTLPPRRDQGRIYAYMKAVAAKLLSSSKSEEL